MEHIITIGKLVFTNMTEEERERFVYHDGVLGFIECVADLLAIDLNDYSAEQIDTMADEIYYSVYED